MYAYGDPTWTGNELRLGRQQPSDRGTGARTPSRIRQPIQPGTRMPAS